MGFKVEKNNFKLEFNDIGIEDAMNLKDAIMKHMHHKNASKLNNGKVLPSDLYNLSLNMSNDKRIREEVFVIIRKYAKKMNGVPLNDQTSIGIIFGERENWEMYGEIYAKIYEEAVVPFLNLPKYMLSTFVKTQKQ